MVIKFSRGLPEDENNQRNNKKAKMKHQPNKKQLHQWIEEYLVIIGRDKKIKINDLFTEKEALDSLSMVNLLIFLEEKTSASLSIDINLFEYFESVPLQNQSLEDFENFYYTKTSQ